MTLGALTPGPQKNAGWKSIAPPSSPTLLSQVLQGMARGVLLSQVVTSCSLFVAVTDRRSEMSPVSPKVSCKQNDSGKQVPGDKVCLAQKGV